MKIEKKHWIIIGVVVAIIVVWYFFMRKKKQPAVIATVQPQQPEQQKQQPGQSGGRWYSQSDENETGYHAVTGRSIPQEKLRWRWPRWLKIGGCKPCIGSPADGCCAGCICQPHQ
jgi:hypothetical protein